MDDVWVVVVEPYFAGSHRSWAEGYARHSEHDVSLLTHRGAFWKWRMHGSSLTLAEDLATLVAERGTTPDAAIVSDMVDVAAFTGLARRSLGTAAVVAFFHENQLTYPLSPGALPDLSYGIKNWLSMAAADEIWFNSEFHRGELHRAVVPLLGSMPDHRHGHAVDDVFGRSRVMSVGIEVPTPEPATKPWSNGPPIVLWNQRWEYDKDPARFFAAIDRAADRGSDFRLAIAGQNFRRRPAEFDIARARHHDRIVHFGEAEPGRYRQLLDEADVVVSTARHEFFGIAVAEAIAAGCLPVLPDALAYPELLGPAHADLLYADDDELDERLASAIKACARGLGSRTDLSESIRNDHRWETVAQRYDQRLRELISC